MNPDDTQGTQEHDLEREDPESQSLHRSVTKRKIAGVAGGIAERFDIDPNIVRVCFVVLTLLWGLGAAVYLAMWVLVPEEGATSTLKSGNWLHGISESKLGWFRSILLVVVVGIGLAIVVEILTRSHIGAGIGVAWLIFLAVLATISVRLPKRRISFGRLLGAVVVVVLVLALIAAGSILGYVSMTGVPIAGGVGQRLYQPTSVGEVHSAYRLVAGTMTVDLRNVSFAGRSLSVNASVGVGNLVVEVPPGVVVDLTAQSGSSGISYPDGEEHFFVTSHNRSSAAKLDLTVRTGIGDVLLVRGAPGVALY